MSGKTSGSWGHMVLIKKGGLWLPTFTAFDDYVCIDCGYVESYILDSEKLREIKANWPHVGDDAQKRKNDEP
jgi:hypothetical protein